MIVSVHVHICTVHIGSDGVILRGRDGESGKVRGGGKEKSDAIV